MHIVGGDISSEGFGRIESSKGFNFYQGDFCRLPFRDASWDCILALDVLEHLAYPEKALAEAYRVLKPRGYLILSTPNFGSIGRKWKGQQWFAYSDATHVHFFDTLTWRELIRAAKFEIIRDGTDTLWNVPYPIPVPTSVQRLVGSLITIFVQTTIVFLPWKGGENYNAVCMKGVS